MLHAVEEVEPLDANQWAVVESKFNQLSTVNDRPNRDMDSLYIKFDKLASIKKPIGDPYCPANVHRAKGIARNIIGKCHACSIGDSSSSDGEQKYESLGNLLAKDSSPDDVTITDSADKKRRASNNLGARRNKRHPA